MSTFTSQQNISDRSQPSGSSLNPGLLLQRKCACGGMASSSLTGECEECKKKCLQKKLSIGASNDPLEQEADRVADQVLAAQENPAVDAGPLRIQRFTGQATGDAGTAPASVDRVLSGSGRPLDPALQQDMGQRFGHDFSMVRVHSGAAAEQSAQEVNAHAYTVGHNIVFGAGRFAPGSQEGRRLIAHELTHVVQQKRCIAPTRIQRLVTDEQLGARADMASMAVGSCGTTVQNCYGRCRAADGSIGVCQWGGLTIGCRCRSNRGAEPPPVPATRSVPWWVYALGGAAAIAIAACFATGVCEAGAIIAAVGEGAAAAIIVLLRAAGILVPG